MNITKKEFIKIDNKFDEYNNKTNESFKYIKGKEKIILSAPHSVSHFRKGKIKAKDSHTGTIAILLQNALNCNCIYKTKNCNDDANYDIENNLYKNELIEIINKNQIKFLLDIHGAKEGQGFDIDVGTSNYNNLNNKKDYASQIVKLGKKYNLNVTIDKVFKASTLHTIANSINAQTKVSCMQIEISKKYRNLENFDNVKVLLNFLEEFLKKILIN